MSPGEPEFDEGLVTGLKNVRVLQVPPFSTRGTVTRLIKPFGGRAGSEAAVYPLQNAR